MNGLAKIVYDEKADNRSAKKNMCGLVTCRSSRGKLRRCAGCRDTRYCNTACQIDDWPYHQATCLVARLLLLIQIAIDENVAAYTLRPAAGYWEIWVQDIDELTRVIERLRSPNASRYLMEVFKGFIFVPISDQPALDWMALIATEAAEAVVRQVPETEEQANCLVDYMRLVGQARRLLDNVRVGVDIAMIIKIRDDGSATNKVARVIPAMIETPYRLKGVKVKKG